MALQEWLEALDSVWMANYKAYKEGLEDMPHRY